MDQIVSNSKCCGCHACMSICPKGAISMHDDKNGFKIPVIDKKKCIDCGLCKKTCPVINSNETKHNIISYACYNTNLDERIKSSSGGIFILLANEIIKRNGVVFGALFGENFEVYHDYIDKESDISKMLGSKYVQSSIGNTYKKAKELLEADRYVLFTGTPCQIEGLLKYLKKDYSKLYTQDIVCHGVPSPRVWNKYLEYLKKGNGNEIKNVEFRNKDNGWSTFRMKVTFKNKLYSKDHKKDLFMKAFLNNICLRESCYNCSFKKKYRNSDITLADYWGVNNVHPNMNDDKGISLVMANTLKGSELFDSIRDYLKVEETNIDDAMIYNSAMIESVKHNKNKEDFMRDLEKDLSFDKVVNKYIHNKTIIQKILNKLIKK